MQILLECRSALEDLSPEDVPLEFEPFDHLQIRPCFSTNFDLVARQELAYQQTYELACNNSDASDGNEVTPWPTPRHVELDYKHYAPPHQCTESATDASISDDELYTDDDTSSAGSSSESDDESDE